VEIRPLVNGSGVFWGVAMGVQIRSHRCAARGFIYDRTAARHAPAAGQLIGCSVRISDGLVEVLPRKHECKTTALKTLNTVFKLLNSKNGTQC